MPSLRQVKQLSQAFTSLSYFELEIESTDFHCSDNKEYVCMLYSPDGNRPYDKLKLKLSKDKNEVDISNDNASSLFKIQVSDMTMRTMSLNIQNNREEGEELKIEDFQSDAFLSDHAIGCDEQLQIRCELSNSLEDYSEQIGVVYLISPSEADLNVAEIRCFAATIRNMKHTRRVVVKLNRSLERPCKMLILALALKLAVITYKLETW